MNNNRPKFLSLHLIRLPLPGLVSILHRVSGALMFIALPLLLWMLQSSLRSIETYTELTDFLRLPACKLVLLLVLWSLLHHLMAGLRLLTIDMGLGVRLAPARATAKLVLAASLAATLLIGVRLW